jgi:hypothetical protein
MAGEDRQAWHRRHRAHARVVKQPRCPPNLCRNAEETLPQACGYDVLQKHQVFARTLVIRLALRHVQSSLAVDCPH